MNIGLLTPYFPDKNTNNSGIANHYFILSKELRRRGHSVVIIHVRPIYENESPSIKKEVLDDGSELITYTVGLSHFTRYIIGKNWAIKELLIRSKAMFVINQKFKTVVSEHRLDVIEASSYFSLSLLLTFRKLAIPLIIRVSTTFCQMMDDYYNFNSRAYKLLGLFELFVIKKSKNLLTHTFTHALELEKAFNIDSSRFQVIPHGIPLPKENSLYNKNNTLKILYVGRLEYRKGTDILLEAIEKVFESKSNIIFDVIGQDTSDYVKSFILKNPSISENVRFHGHADGLDLESAYAKCDFFVAPSRYESFGLIFIEAMSFGKPVIALDVGGAKDIIVDGYNGLLTFPFEADYLAKNIIRLIDDDELRQTMGINARKTVIQNYSSDILVENSLQLYKTLAKKCSN